MHREKQGAPAYGFGVKVSVATPIAHAKGGQFALHAKAMPSNPYDGHTLATVIPRSKRWSATPSSAFSPMPDTAATMRRPNIDSGSTPPVRSCAWRPRSSARCGAAQLSNR